MLVVVWASSWGLVAQAAETHAFTLENGNVVEGYIADMDEETLIVRKNRGDFSERIELVYLSQETLKWIKQQPSYLAKGYDQLVDPYLELPEEEIQPPIINVRDPERPLQAVTKEDGSFVASLGSPIGLLLVLAVYFGNLYAALHIAQFMSRPVAVVCGVSAIFPVFGPILFACMPPMVEESHAASAPDVPAAPSSGGAPPPLPPLLRRVRLPSRDWVSVWPRRAELPKVVSKGRFFRATIPNLPRVFSKRLSQNSFERCHLPRSRVWCLPSRPSKKKWLPHVSPVFLPKICTCALRVRKKCPWHLGRS